MSLMSVGFPEILACLPSASGAGLILDKPRAGATSATQTLSGSEAGTTCPSVSAAG